jgi:hypothetical protein
MGRYAEMLKGGVPGIDMKEFGKEIFGHLGYADGSRFFSGQDPQVLMLQQQVQHLQGIVQQLQKKVADKTDANKIALQKTFITETNKKEIAANREAHEDRRSMMTHWSALHQQAADHRHERFQHLIEASRPRPREVA